MRKPLMLLLPMIILALMLPATVFAATNEHSLELTGEIKTSALLVAVVPTTSQFVYDLEKTEWNKIISPDIVITNNSSMDIDAKVVKVEVDFPGDFISLVSAAPAQDLRQIRIALAPDATYAAIADLTDYFLTEAVSAANPIELSSGIRGSGGEVKFRLFGDIGMAADQWDNGETFTLNTVIKISVTP